MLKIALYYPHRALKNFTLLTSIPYLYFDYIKSINKQFGKHIRQQ